jgi:tellurite methyltransferase
MSQSVRRTIRGFHVDDEGQWVAELSCFHNQHVRHRPPFENRPWVLNNERRAEHIGTPIDCTLCFDGELPTALRAPHEIADGRWGLFRVGEGATRLILDEQSRDVLLQAGEERAIPPAVVHHLEIVGHVSIEIDFLAPR